MKKKIEKSSRVSSDLEKWIPILETCNFPKEHYNLGSEYCDFHSKKIVGTISDNLLPMSLFILKSLNLDNLNEYYLTDENETFKLMNIDLEQCDIDSMIHGGIESKHIMNHIDHIIRKDLIDIINKKIEESEEKIVEFGKIVSSIFTIKETDKPIIYVSGNIKIKN